MNYKPSAAQLIDLADTNNPRAAAEVAALAETMGQLLEIPAWQLKRLRLAGLLHRIAPMSVSLQYERRPAAWYRQRRCCEPCRECERSRKSLTTKLSGGTAVVSWVSREEISLESRILGLVEDFQQRVTKLQASDSSLPETSVLTQALAECKQQGIAGIPNSLTP